MESRVIGLRWDGKLAQYNYAGSDKGVMKI